MPDCSTAVLARISSRSERTKIPISCGLTPSARRLFNHAATAVIQARSDSGWLTISMDFRIADILTESLSRLTADEQKAVKTAAFDLQLNPPHPGLQFHKLDKAKDHNFWSVRVTLDIRMIVHRTQASLLLCRRQQGRTKGHHLRFQWRAPGDPRIEIASPGYAALRLAGIQGWE